MISFKLKIPPKKEFEIVDAKTNQLRYAVTYPGEATVWAITSSRSEAVEYTKRYAGQAFQIHDLLESEDY